MGRPRKNIASNDKKFQKSEVEKNSETSELETGERFSVQKIKDLPGWKRVTDKKFNIVYEFEKFDEKVKARPLTMLSMGIMKQSFDDTRKFIEQQKH
jgi:hypothetical protein